MPWIRFHCCSLYRCLFRWEMALSCSPQTSSAVVLLWLWFLFLQVNLHQVLKPHGHGITLPISVTLGCSWDGDIVVSSSSTLLLGSLDTLSGGLFTLVFLMLKLFKKPLGNCSIFSIFWFPRVKGGKSKPQRCDQISFPTAKNYLYFLSISFISCLLVARKGLKRKFKSI